MGLDTTHDCWHGSYIAFGKWREAIARAAGIELNRMRGFTWESGCVNGLIDFLLPPDNPIDWSELPQDILHVLLNHSDCDGIILAADCEPLAERLEEILPLLPQ